MNTPTLWIQHDAEIAEVMSDIQADYHPGQRIFSELAALEDSEIDFAVDVLVPVHG